MHRAAEAKRIEKAPYFRKELRHLTAHERGRVATWNEIINERLAMLPVRKLFKSGPQARKGRVA